MTTTQTIDGVPRELIQWLVDMKNFWISADVNLSCAHCWKPNPRPSQ